MAFPPVDAWPLVFVGLLGLLVELEKLADRAREGAPGAVSRGFAAGAGAGLALYLFLLWWIVVLDAPALTIPWVRYPGTLAVVAFLSLYTGAFGAAYVFVRSRLPVPPPIVAGVLWTAFELLRGRGELGFPWGALGYGLVPFRAGLQVASVAGISGLTFWVAAVNALWLPIVRGRASRGRAIAFGMLAVLIPAVLGAVRLARAPERPTVRVALVQPSVGNAEKWDPAQRAAIFDAMGSLSREGAAKGAELVVWPETAAPCYLLKDREWRPWVEALAAELSVPLFVGVPDYEIVREGGTRRVTYTNTGAYFDASGQLAGRMDKIRLVPFGERIPFSQWIPLLARVDFGEADFLPGKAPVLFEQDGWKFGNLVCFEATYPDLVREHANKGAEVLVNITNDSWFGAGSGAEQHKRMAVVRCVETGCGMARCANSGISCGVDAYGDTSGETPLFERTVSVVDVPLRRGRTAYARLGDWAGIGSALSGAAFLGAGFARRRGLR
jgi:apolipoprotein N-acyltransferase